MLRTVRFLLIPFRLCLSRGCQSSERKPCNHPFTLTSRAAAATQWTYHACRHVQFSQIVYICCFEMQRKTSDGYSTSGRGKFSFIFKNTDIIDSLGIVSVIGFTAC